MVVQRRIALALTLILVGMNWTGVHAAPAVSSTFGVASMVCDHDPGPFGGRDERMPVGCRWQPGVKLTVMANDGKNYSSCVTGDNGWCHLPVTSFRLLLLKELTTIPNDVAPVMNPTPVFFSANGGWVVNIPKTSFPAPPSSGAMLTIHSRICPKDYAGPDYYVACNPNSPGFNQRFSLYGPTQTAGDLKGDWAGNDGNVTFDHLNDGD